MGIFTLTDLAWGFLIPIAVIVAAILFQPRWIPRSVLVTFVIYKMVICIATNVWIVGADAPSDSVGYYLDGLTSAAKLRDLFKGESNEYLTDSFFLWTDGISTSRLNSLSGLLLVLTGESFIAENLLLCIVGILGQLLLFRYLIDRFPEANRKYFYVLLFHPSLSLWSSAMLKDTIGIFALGCAFFNVNRCMSRFAMQNLFWVGVSVYLAYLYRPYTLLIIFVLAMFMFWDNRIDRMASRLRADYLFKWAYVNVAILLAVGGIVYFVKFHAEELVYLARSSDEEYSKIDAGSTFTNVSVSYSMSGIAALPIGVMNTLCRPFLWESRKLNQFLAALENVFVLAFVFRGWYVFLFRAPEPLRRYCRSIMYGGILVTVITSSAIGLFSSNLGTISRYRIPVIPTLLAGPCVILAMRNQKRLRVAARMPPPMRLAPA